MPRNALRRAVLAMTSLFVSAGASVASAQVFYMPVQYQYQSPNGGGTYYYGGSDPAVHLHANQNSLVSGWGRTNGYAFHSGDYQVHREVVNEPTRIYSDAVSSLQNGRFYGFTANDAANEAYANASRYFRKADVVKNRILQEDGTWVVPAYDLPRGTITIRPYVASADAKRPAVEAKPKAAPKPVLIIPKRLLDKPLWGTPTPMASAKGK